MNILLTGKNGQVGFELQRALAPLGEVVAVDLDECDLSDANANRRLVAEQEPEELDRLTLLMMTSLFDLEAAQWPHRNG